MSKLYIKVIEECSDCGHYGVAVGDVDVCAFDEYIPIDDISKILDCCPLEDVELSEYD